MSLSLNYGFLRWALVLCGPGERCVWSLPHRKEECVHSRGKKKLSKGAGPETGRRSCSDE